MSEQPTATNTTRGPFPSRTTVLLAIMFAVWLCSCAAFVVYLPAWSPHAAIIGIALIYFVIGGTEYRSDDTPDGYFLFDRRMPSHYFVWTFVSTNIGLFSSIAFSAILAYYYGIAGMVWTTAAWFLGMYSRLSRNGVDEKKFSRATGEQRRHLVRLPPW